MEVVIKGTLSPLSTVCCWSLPTAECCADLLVAGSGRLGSMPHSWCARRRNYLHHLHHHHHHDQREHYQKWTGVYLQLENHAAYILLYCGRPAERHHNSMSRYTHTHSLYHCYLPTLSFSFLKVDMLLISAATTPAARFLSFDCSKKQWKVMASTDSSGLLLCLSAYWQADSASGGKTSLAIDWWW